MLDTFRKIIQGWFGKALVALIILPFAFFGISSIFEVSNNRDTVAEVNGEDIVERDLLRAIEVNKQNIISQLGDQASSFVTNEMLRPTALGGLIDQELIKQSAEKNGMRVSIDVIHKMIADMEVFKIDGKFSQRHFEDLLRRNGLIPETFPDKIRDDFLSQQVKNGYLTTGFSTETEISSILALKNQRRTFQYAEFDPEMFYDKVAISNEQVSEFYDKHKEEYRTKESVVLDYLVLNKSDYITDDDVSDDEIKQKYQDRITELKESQERSASHVLIEINDKRTKSEALKLAEDLYKRINKGEDLADLAKTYSDDKGSATSGGSLGFAVRGAYVEEFEKTLFSLEPGEVSKPVLTEFGYHIIRADGVRPELPAYDQIKTQLVEELKLDKAQQPYQDTLESLKNITYESSNLDESANFLKKKVITSASFTRNDSANSDEITSFPAVNELAFSQNFLDAGNNSDVIELDSNRAVVFRIHEHVPSKIKTLDSVKQDIVLRLTEIAAKDRVKKLGKDVVADLKAGESLQEIEQKYAMSWKKAENVSRDETKLGVELVDMIFKLPKQDQGHPSYADFNLSNNHYVVAIFEALSPEIKDVNSPEKMDKSSVEEVKQILINQKGLIELHAFQAWLKEDAEVKIN
jgi:peptidyl-prolyl cis-trans isomerase D